MAEVTAAQIKKVRELTGAGMSAVKQALVAADGDENAAIDALRAKGQTQNEKRQTRSADNGLVAAAEGVMVQIACETDFVAKNEALQTLAGDIVAHAAKSGAKDLATLLAETLADGRTVETAIGEAGATLQEKIELARFARVEGTVSTYLHKKAADLPAQLGVLIGFSGGGDTGGETARGVAMQGAAMKAQYLSREQVPAEAVERERAVAEEKARNEGKPDAILPKIIDGRVAGFYKEVVLLEQDSVLESKKSVKQVLDAAGVTVTEFVRFEVGQA